MQAHLARVEGSNGCVVCILTFQGSTMVILHQRLLGNGALLSGSVSIYHDMIIIDTVPCEPLRAADVCSLHTVAYYCGRRSFCPLRGPRHLVRCCFLYTTHWQRPSYRNSKIDAFTMLRGKPLSEVPRCSPSLVHWKHAFATKLNTHPEGGGSSLKHGYDRR